MRYPCQIIRNHYQFLIVYRFLEYGLTSDTSIISELKNYISSTLPNKAHLCQMTNTLNVQTMKFSLKKIPKRCLMICLIFTPSCIFMVLYYLLHLLFQPQNQLANQKRAILHEKWHGLTNLFLLFCKFLLLIIKIINNNLSIKETY